MRRDITQQLCFDNATDLAVALGVPLLPLIFCSIAALTGLDQAAREQGSNFAGGPASIFCSVIFCWSVLNTFLAAITMSNYARRVMLRHCEQLRQYAQNPTMPQMPAPDSGVVSSATAGGPVTSSARVIRELGLHFGTWCRTLREDSAPLAFRIPMVAFNTLVIIVWLISPLLLPNACPPPPSLLPAGVLLWTICGYLSFNMGYRIGVRQALCANLGLLGMAAAPTTLLQ